jgi:hypothetical protein
VIIALLAADAVEVDEHPRQLRKNIWHGSVAAQAAIGSPRTPPASEATETPQKLP